MGRQGPVQGGLQSVASWSPEDKGLPGKGGARVRCCRLSPESGSTLTGLVNARGQKAAGGSQGVGQAEAEAGGTRSPRETLCGNIKVRGEMGGSRGVFRREMLRRA